MQQFHGARDRSWQSTTTVYQFAGRCAHTGSRKPDIKIIRITEFRRIARKVRLLEIDTTDDRLFVLTRWDLGTDPLEVLDALTAAGLRRPLDRPSGDGDRVDHDRVGRPVPTVGRRRGDGIDDVRGQLVGNLAEDGVLAVPDAA